MTWVKLDDGYPEHLKVIGLSDAAFRTDVEGWCYCARTLSDGLIPTAAAKRWPRKAIAELVVVGRWHRDVEGFRIHDYLDYNPSRSQVLADRERAAERQRKSRGSHGVTSAEHPRESHDPDPTRPVPDPKDGEAKALRAVPDDRPDDDQLSLAMKLGEAWDQELGIPALQKLNTAYGRPTVTGAMRSLHGFPPAEAVRSLYAYLESIAKAEVSA